MKGFCLLHLLSEFGHTVAVTLAILGPRDDKHGEENQHGKNVRAEIQEEPEFQMHHPAACPGLPTSTSSFMRKIHVNFFEAAIIHSFVTNSQTHS